MNNIVDTWIKEIKDRCKNQNIDIKDCLIMFQRNQTYFNGEEIYNFSESKDGKWMRVPVYNDKPSYMSFEIKDKMTTYLSNGYMQTLTTIWLLKEP